MEICLVEGCQRGVKVLCRGLCNKHYIKWRLYGNPLSGYERKHKNGEGFNSGGYYAFSSQIYPGVYARKLGHVLIIKKALGHKIPSGAESHHVDGKKSNNVNTNLVLCDSAAYHQLLHIRQEAYDSCGNAKWRRCPFCKKFDDSKNMWICPTRNVVYHKSCRNKNDRERRARIKKEELA